jgi:peptide/nickel transport system substrate-binding protein
LKSRSILALVAGLIVVALVAYVGLRPEGPAGPVKSAVGAGRLAVAYRSEPVTFNRLVTRSPAEELITRLTHATLVRLNRVTHELEPRLATAWAASSDGLTWTFELMEGVMFSDGTPFTSADVLFTFRALYDERVQSEIAPDFRVGGEPLAVRALDDHTVVIQFPEPFSPGIGMLDSLPILPRHKLGAALDDGTFRDAWNVQTPLEEVVGLGPFVVTEFVAGERLRLDRNPRFWRADADGRSLPYLDGIDIAFVPEQNAEMLMLESGAADLTTAEIRGEDVAAFRRLERDGRVRLLDAGVSIGPDGLWFNLASGSVAVNERPWLALEAFRHAVSLAVDRQRIADTVYLGAAEPIYGPITRSYGDWYLEDLPRPAHDPDAARALLTEAGLVDRDGDGLLEDRSGTPAQFSVMTVSGSIRERVVTLIQQQLGEVGLRVDVAALDAQALIERIIGGDYEATYFNTQPSSFDPGRNLDYWLSSGFFHLWNPAQAVPATDWEARIDDLMRRQVRAFDPSERQSLFAEVQRTLAEHLPILYFVAPHVTLAASARVAGAQPSVLQPPILWNAETLSLRSPAERPDP